MRKVAIISTFALVLIFNEARRGCYEKMYEMAIGFLPAAGTLRVGATAGADWAVPFHSRAEFAHPGHWAGGIAG